MSITLTVGSETFEIPVQGGSAPWGEETTSFLQAVSEALTTVQGPNDILLTSATLGNNILAPTSIPGLSFNTGDVKSVFVEYLIERVYNPGSGNETITESGLIIGNYNGSEFNISVQSSGNEDSGVDINVDNSGQFTYTSDDKPTHVSMTISYKAKTIDS